MLLKFNDNGAIDVRGTDKNLAEMQAQGKDLRLCIRNILVQRFLYGQEDLEALPHSVATITLARKMIRDSAMQLMTHATRQVRNIRDRWDYGGRLELRP